MSDWKLGYIAGLKDVAGEEAGIALYDSWGLNSLILSSKSPLRVKGTASSTSSPSFSVGQTLVANSLAGGTCRFINGNEAGKHYHIVSNTTSSITLDSAISSVTGSYFEAVTGESTFTFSSGHSPELLNVKMQVNGIRERFTFNKGGYDVQYGRFADSFVLRARLTDFSEVVTLFTLLTNPVSYSGKHAILESEEAAPLILVEGDTGKQYLVHVHDGKVIGDASMGEVLTISLTLSEFVTPLLRGY